MRVDALQICQDERSRDRPCRLGGATGRDEDPLDEVLELACRERGHQLVYAAARSRSASSTFRPSGSPPSASASSARAERASRSRSDAIVAKAKPVPIAALAAAPDLVCRPAGTLVPSTRLGDTGDHLIELGSRRQTVAEPEVAGAHVHGVDTGCPTDRLEVLDGRDGLHHDDAQDAEIPLRRRRAEAAGGPHGSPAADAVRRIAARGGGPGRLGRRRDERDDHPTRAEVEHAADEPRLVRRNAHEGKRACRRDRLDRLRRRLEAVETVLEVDADVREAEPAEDFDAQRATERAPGSEDAAGHPRPERVG